MPKSAPRGISFLKKKENRYLWYILILPAYLIAFALVEALVPESICWPTYLPIDDKIPFLEGFVIPYFLWFPMIFCMGLYLVIRDHEGFKRYMTFIGVAFFTTLLIYCIFPNKQELRPVQFPRDNVLTRLVATIYASDTNTNVCPSIHVIGSFGVVFALQHCRRLRNKAWLRFFIIVGAALVSISTVFVKQHSLLDILVAIPFSILMYFLVYRLIFRPKRQKARTDAQEQALSALSSEE